MLINLNWLVQGSVLYKLECSFCLDDGKYKLRYLCSNIIVVVREAIQLQTIYG